MDIKILSFSALLSLLPISELRGAIPFLLAKGYPLIFTYFYCVFFNILVAPLFYLFISSFHKIFLKIKLYETLFNKFVEKSRLKLKDKIDKYGYLGIALFVAIPLPITGAYTGTIGAWVLGMKAKKSFLSVTLGVFIAGLIVSTVSILGIEAFSFLLKKVHS